MSNRVTLAAAIVAICGACISCKTEYVKYVVEITPTDSGIDRRVTAVQIDVSESTETRVRLRLGPEVADRFERVYGLRPDTVDSYTASGHFTTVPDDIGNWGTLRRFDSALGRAWIYAERVRGDMDLPAGVEETIAAADSMIDILLGWTGMELGRHPGWPALRSYLDRDLRRVLRDHSLRTWLADSISFDQLQVIVLEHPVLVGIPSADSAGDGIVYARIRTGFALAEMRNSFATIMGLKTHAEKDETLRFIARPATARQSLSRYIAGAAGETQEAAASRWDRVIRQSLVGGTAASRERDSLEVRLAVPSGCVDLDANGARDSLRQEVVWSGEIQETRGHGSAPPLVCHAAWAMPDSVRQRRAFGKVLLGDGKLLPYCMWFHTLDAAHQAEWDRMLLRLRPGNLKPLERFKFSDEKAPEPGRDIPGRKLILDAADRGHSRESPGSD